MSTNLKFEGWVGEDPSAVDGNLVWKEFKPKEWEESDVDIRVTHSAICGSDIHTLRNDWGATSFPAVVGHEIVGVVVRVGRDAGEFIAGDVVGVGCQADSCRSRDGPCQECDNDEENYCPKRVNTYDSTHRNGSPSYGGYSLYHRCPGHFVIKIPEGLAPEHAAPMLCGGVTVYAPLRRFRAGPGRRIDIIGVGGLGHFAIMFAKAMGASKVVALSRRSDKKEDALRLGADEYIAVAEDDKWSQTNARSLDLIISTVSSSKIPLKEYFGLLVVGGQYIQVGAPEEPLPVMALALIRPRISLTGSIIGSPQDIRDMFKLAAEKGVKPWIETRPMKEANEAVRDQVKGLPRFRYVLTN
ncbi:putative formaldehyde dehydrogenase AdhA [Colletotrichum siamense]|nr:putative formaldehyde dehydrogenase AdhA [Colletotrichum siamense]